MTPLYRFTLNGNKRISDPVGWETLVINLDRDQTYHSLIEIVDTPLEFWGRTSQFDGGYQFLKEARANGVNTQITFLAEVSFDSGATYDTVWDGLLDMTTLKEIEHNKKFQCGILRDDLWAKFINRKTTKVNVRSTVNLDGAGATVFTPKDITLTAQTLRQRYEGRHFTNVDYATTTVGGYIYGIIDFESLILDEIEEKFDYPRVAINVRPSELFAVAYNGEYQFDSSISLTTNTIAWAFPVNSQIFFQINDETPIAFTEADLGTPGVDGRTNFTYSDSHTLQQGDFIRIYIQSADPCSWVGSVDTNFLTVSGETTFEATTEECLATHDVALAICERITGLSDSFYSRYFGYIGAEGLPYFENGIGSQHVNMLGLHVRGYSFDDKPLSMSFDEWWEGVNPIFNLGLGYEDGRIRVESKDYFYSVDSPLVFLVGVNDIMIETEMEYLFTSIEQGYQKWDVESDTGLDDPQTKHTYATIIKTAGSKDTKDVKNLSTMYAAGLGIEQTRRTKLQAGKDWVLDDSVVIIQAIDVAASPVTPLLYTSPAHTITNVLNSDTRYNLGITPAQNFIRWQFYYAIGLYGFYNYVGALHRFTGGEGNTDMTWTDNFTFALPYTIAENQNMVVPDPEDYTTDLFKSILYSFTHNLSWAKYKVIRENPTRPISVSYTGNDGVVYTAICYIKKLAYRINDAEADFQVWIKSI